MVLPRSLNLFHNALGSEKTYVNYKWQLDQFLKWNKLTDYDDLLKADDKSIQRLLEDYLMYLKENNSANYIPSIMAPVELFYTMNGKNFNKTLLHKMFPTKTKKSGYDYYTREDIESMLENTNKTRTKALILFLSSTGCRVGVIPELKLGHITNLENCKQVLCYADSNEEYTTFMTPEASQVFDDYLAERQQDREKLTAESPAFRSQYVLGDTPARTMETGTIRNALAITTKDVKRTKKGNRFNKQTLHALRKFFNVQLKSRHDNNLSLSEKLMGHSTSIPLDNRYGSFSNEALFEEYKKSIPALSISKQYKLQEQIKKNEEESKATNDKLTDKMYSLERDNLDMKVRFEQLKEIVKNLSEKD